MDAVQCEVQCPSTRSTSQWEATRTALAQLESLLHCKLWSVMKRFIAIDIGTTVQNIVHSVFLLLWQFAVSGSSKSRTQSAVVTTIFASESATQKCVHKLVQVSQMKCNHCSTYLLPLAGACTTLMFCRVCAYNSFDNSQKSSCPECKLPAWRRDVTPNHQLASVVDLIAEMYQTIKEPSHMDGTTPCSSNLRASPLLPSASNADKDVFRTPTVTRDIIERHIAARLSSTPRSVVPANKALLSDKDLMAFGSSNLLHTNSLPNVKCEEVESKLIGVGACPLVSVAQVERESDSAMDEKPRIKRRRRVVRRLCETEKKQHLRPGAKTTVEFPYTPIFTKTRNFARLNNKDRISRLGAVFRPSSGGGVGSKDGLLQEQASVEKEEPSMELSATKQSVSLAPVGGVQTRRALAAQVGQVQCGAVGGAVVRSSVLVKALKRNLKGETQLHIAAIKVC